MLKRRKNLREDYERKVPEVMSEKDFWQTYFKIHYFWDLADISIEKGLASAVGEYQTPLQQPQQQQPSHPSARMAVRKGEVNFAVDLLSDESLKGMVGCDPFVCVSCPLLFSPLDQWVLKYRLRQQHSLP